MSITTESGWPSFNPGDWGINSLAGKCWTDPKSGTFKFSFGNDILSNSDGIYFRRMPPSMINVHWFRYWLGAVRHQAITWANVGLDLCRHMASLGPNDVKTNKQTNKKPRQTEISSAKWRPFCSGLNISTAGLMSPGHREISEIGILLFSMTVKPQQSTTYHFRYMLYDINTYWCYEKSLRKGLKSKATKTRSISLPKWRHMSAFINTFRVSY